MILSKKTKYFSTFLKKYNKFHFYRDNYVFSKKNIFFKILIKSSKFHFTEITVVFLEKKHIFQKFAKME